MKKTDEEKLLLDPYVSLSTIQRRFSLTKIEATDIFVKIQEFDKENGYTPIHKDKVRSEAVFEKLGLDINLALTRYKIKKGINNESIN